MLAAERYRARVIAKCAADHDTTTETVVVAMDQPGQGRLGTVDDADRVLSLTYLDHLGRSWQAVYAVLGDEIILWMD